MCERNSVFRYDEVEWWGHVNTDTACEFHNVQAVFCEASRALPNEVNYLKILKFCVI
jgi:hypothetical protein